MRGGEVGRVDDVEVLLYVHRNRRLIGTGAQDGHLDFHTASKLLGEVGVGWGGGWGGGSIFSYDNLFPTSPSPYPRLR